MITENLDYVAAGKARNGYLAHDGGHVRRRPCVLVCHEGAGLGAHVREQTRRLAGQGYVALALDLFGGPFESREQGMATIQGMVADPSGVRSHGAEALALLRERPDVDPDCAAVIGFCFGGWAAMEMARGGLEARAVVAFHGGLHTTAPAKVGEVKAALLACTGADDPHVPAAQRDAFVAEMTAACADWRIELFGGVQHGFTDPSVDPARWPGSAYDARAAARSWRAMLDLFAEVFV